MTEKTTDQVHNLRDALPQAPHDILHQLCQEEYGITAFVLCALTDAITYVQGKEYKPDKFGDWRPAAAKIKKHLDL